MNILFPVPGSLKPKQLKDLRSILSPNQVTYPESKKEEPTLGVGVKVKLVNLNNAEFNGKTGTIIGSQQQRGRWALELDNGKQVAVPEKCLEIVKEEEAKLSTKPKSSNPDEMDDEDDYIDDEDVVATVMEGEPETTPAAIKSQFDDDDDEDKRVECRQM